MGRKKTHEEYLSDLASKKKLYLPMEAYIGSKTPIVHRHITCGHKWKTTPDDILRGRGCPKCSKTALKTHDVYIEELKNTEYISLEKYIDSRTKILHRHNICGHEWFVMPANILSGQGCPNCSKSGLKPGLRCSLYLVKFYYLSDFYYKIGITQKDIPARFRGDWNRFNMEIVWYREFSDYHRAKEAESLILKEYSDYKVNTGLLASGNTETFCSTCSMLADLQ